MKIISYWIVPVLSGLVWLSMLLGLLLHWVIDLDYQHYPSMAADATIAYISDTGAFRLKPLFITGCIITTLLLDASFVLDRWLRHQGRLVPETSRGQKILSALTLFFAVLGTIGLCCLSGFDTYQYHIAHDVFILFFMGGYLLSAVCICWEYQRLGFRYRDHRILRISFWIKLSFILVEFALSIAFVTFNWTNRINMAACVEWTIAFIFSLYIFSFAIDLWPAVHTGSHNKYRRNSQNRPLRGETPGQQRDEMVEAGAAGYGYRTPGPAGDASQARLVRDRNGSAIGSGGGSRRAGQAAGVRAGEATNF